VKYTTDAHLYGWQEIDGMTENKEKSKKQSSNFPFGLGDIAELGIHLIILKPIMWISALVFETASYYYNGGCTDCHKRQSILNKWNPDVFKMLWGLFDNKDKK